MSTYQLEIITPERVFYSGEVDRIVIRGSEGEMAILANHTPLVTGLTPGALKIYTTDEKVWEASLTEGFIKIAPTHVAVLTDAAEWPGEIDIERAKRSKERAEAYMKEPNKYDYARAQAALKRALIRMSVGQHNRDMK